MARKTFFIRAGAPDTFQAREARAAAAAAALMQEVEEERLAAPQRAAQARARKAQKRATKKAARRPGGTAAAKGAPASDDCLGTADNEAAQLRSSKATGGGRTEGLGGGPECNVSSQPVASLRTCETRTTGSDTEKGWDTDSNGDLLSLLLPEAPAAAAGDTRPTSRANPANQPGPLPAPAAAPVAAPHVERSVLRYCPPSLAPSQECSAAAQLPPAAPCSQKAAAGLQLLLRPANLEGIPALPSSRAPPSLGAGPSLAAGGQSASPSLAGEECSAALPSGRGPSSLGAATQGSDSSLAAGGPGTTPGPAAAGPQACHQSAAAHDVVVADFMKLLLPTEASPAAPAPAPPPSQQNQLLSGCAAPLVRCAQPAASARPRREAPPAVAAASAEEEERALQCPITMEVMEDPVIAADGHTYERAAMENWLRCSRAQPALSPMTGLPLASQALWPNLAVRALIQHWRQGA